MFSYISVGLELSVVRTVSGLKDRQPAELFPTEGDKSLQIARYPDALPDERIR